MTPDRARELVAEISVSVDGIRDRLVELYEGRGWDALGYGSWAELCAHEFGTAVGELLPRSRRPELVERLTEAGLSTTAIGQALGVSDRTVRRSQVRQNAAPVTGLDGKTYARPTRPRPQLSEEDIARALRDGSGRSFLDTLRRLADPDGPLVAITGYADDSDACRDLVDYLDDLAREAGWDPREFARRRLEEIRYDVDRAVTGLLAELNRPTIRRLS